MSDLVAKDSFLDADGERSLRVSAGMGVLFEMGGYERLARNVATVPDLADPFARRLLAGVRDTLYSEEVDAFRDYPGLRDRLDSLVRTYGRTLPSDIDAIVLESLLDVAPETLAVRGEALIRDLETRAETGDTEGFAETVTPLTRDHFRRHLGIAHNNVAHYWRLAGHLENALHHQMRAVAVLNATGGLGTIPAIDRRYALAAVLMEMAAAVYDEARRLDLDLTRAGNPARLEASELEYPVLKSLGEEAR
ncbi:MAG: hypothetical protein ACO1SV_00940 [Fimbriimonas sp.]